MNEREVEALMKRVYLIVLSLTVLIQGALGVLEAGPNGASDQNQLYLKKLESLRTSPETIQEKITILAHIFAERMMRTDSWELRANSLGKMDPETLNQFLINQLTDWWLDVQVTKRFICDAWHPDHRKEMLESPLMEKIEEMVRKRFSAPQVRR